MNTKGRRNLLALLVVMALVTPLSFPALASILAATEEPPTPPTSWVSTTSFHPAPTIPVFNISGSTLDTENCYEADSAQTLCFTVFNASTDYEWLDQVRLTFPALLGDWTVACKTQDATDSGGNPVSFSCNALNNEVVYQDNDADGYGEILAGYTWGFCVDVTIPSGYNGDRVINWGFSGDDAGSTPHDITGTFNIEECMPLMFDPNTLTTEGCNGTAQTHVFELWNNTGSDGTFNLTYDVSSGNASFTGPASVSITAGNTETVSTTLTPDLSLFPGQQVNASLQATGNSASDTVSITKTISEFAGWETKASSVAQTMDQVVVWAVQDGGLWSIGGYGSNGATQRYDPSLNTWGTYTAEPTPNIEYPMDGCYGLDGDGHEVVVLFPDTVSSVTTLHRYDITDDTWDTPAVPAGFPGGRWSQDITSLYPITGENLCYISGGATGQGGGDVKNLWEYRPATNITVFLGNFSHHEAGFDFHASWYVPWVGDQGAICVGGGIDSNHTSISNTQCYDLATASFNTPNADLGQLPEAWWGMADGWKTHNGAHQIWIANGVDASGQLLKASAYADSTTGVFVNGPEPSIGLYRLEGTGWSGHFYAEQGAAGGFNYTAYNRLLGQCPTCNRFYLPQVIAP